MKRNYFFIVLFTACTGMQVSAQQVAINEDGSLPNQHAILDVKSANKGILLPRTSTVSRLAIPNTKGLLVYDTTTHSFWYNTGTGWQNLAGAPTSGNGWLVTGNTGTSEPNFLGTIDSVPFRLRVNNQPAGFMTPALQGSTTWGYKSHGLNNPANYYENTAIGSRAMYKNTGGFSTAVGGLSLYNNTGYSNTAVGYASLIDNTSGSNNAAFGNSASSSNKTGNENTAVGFYALLTPKSRHGNTAVGYYSGPNNDYANTVALGAYAVPSYSNKVRIGNASIMEIEGQVPYTTPSDGRFKSSVQEDVKGLDFVMKLRPVTYNFDARKFDEQLRGGDHPQFMQANEDMNAAYEQSAAIRRSGFIAQEVEKAAGDAGYNFSGIIKPRTEKGYYSISYESFVPALVKAVQELNKKVEELQAQNADLWQELKILMQNFK